jgi:hypothetical protein
MAAGLCVRGPLRWIEYHPNAIRHRKSYRVFAALTVSAVAIRYPSGKPGSASGQNQTEEFRG